MSEIDKLNNELSGVSCLAFGEITDALEKHFDAEVWNVEWRSVMNAEGDAPLWSMTIYVEAQENK